MAKGLRQVTIPNPSVESLKPKREKEFASKHKVLKTLDPYGNGDKPYKSDVPVFSRKSYANSDEPSKTTNPYPGVTQSVVDTPQKVTDEIDAEWEKADEETEVNEIMWPLGSMKMKKAEAKKPAITSPKANPMTTKYNKETKKYETKRLNKEEWLREISQKLIREYSGGTHDLGTMWGKGKGTPKKSKSDWRPNSDLGAAWDRPAKKIKWPTPIKQPSQEHSKGSVWGSGGKKSKYKEVAGQLRHEETELNEKSKSRAQARLMAACAHGAGYSSCPPKKISKEFNQKDKGTGILKGK